MARNLTQAELRATNRETWFIRTYCTKEQIEDTFDNDDRIEWWRAIWHDKDTDEENKTKEPHAHIVIKFKQRIKGSTVYNLFKDQEDSKGQKINTELQIPNNIRSCIEYLTHNTKKAKREGKYQYSEDEIFGEGEIDISSEGNHLYIKMIMDVRDGRSPIGMVQEYGMLYIANYRNIKGIALEQQDWENAKKFENAKRKYEQDNTPTLEPVSRSEQETLDN